MGVEEKSSHKHCLWSSLSPPLLNFVYLRFPLAISVSRTQALYNNFFFKQASHLLPLPISDFRIEECGPKLGFSDCLKIGVGPEAETLSLHYQSFVTGERPVAHEQRTVTIVGD